MEVFFMGKDEKVDEVLKQYELDIKAGVQWL